VSLKRNHFGYLNSFQRLFKKIETIFLPLYDIKTFKTLTMNTILYTIVEEDVWDLLDFSNVTVRRGQKSNEPIKFTDSRFFKNNIDLLEPIAVVRPFILKSKPLDFSKVTIRRK
jgi:hypothetical protein